MKTMLTFDDVILQPYYNNVESRTEPSLETWLTRNHKIGSPILAANMQCVIGPELADVLTSFGSTPIFHRFTTSEQIKEWVAAYPSCFISWGVNNVKELINLLDDMNPVLPTGVCFDIAHGHSLKMRQAIETFKRSYDLDVIAGNVCRGTAVHDLANWGADAVKVGIGPGAACTTRKVTGFGAPQFSAIQECAKVAFARKIPVIADGGIRGTDDIVKALAAGACTVMMGKAFCATDQSDAEKAYRDRGGMIYSAKRRELDVEGKLPPTEPVARYRGQASAAFQRKGLKPEGEEAWIPVTGSAGELLDDLHKGIRSGLTYGGARTIKELQEHASFVQVTPSYAQEAGTRL